MSITDVHFNYIAILAAAIIYMLVGAIWYSPQLFGTTWMKSMGYRKEELKATAGKAYAGAFIGALITAFVLALFIHHLNAYTIRAGACVGFWAWLGFIVPNSLGGVLWDRMPWKVFFIHIGCTFVALLLMGALLGYWH